MTDRDQALAQEGFSLHRLRIGENYLPCSRCSERAQQGSHMAAVAPSARRHVCTTAPRLTTATEWSGSNG
jgi:hypothetical protein